MLPKKPSNSNASEARIARTAIYGMFSGMRADLWAQTHCHYRPVYAHNISILLIGFN